MTKFAKILCCYVKKPLVMFTSTLQLKCTNPIKDNYKTPK